MLLAVKAGALSLLGLPLLPRSVRYAIAGYSGFRTMEGSDDIRG